jgi:amino acid adenylation domain-containing protein
MLELRTLYEALTRQSAVPPPLPPIQHADFATRQRQQMQGDTLKEHLSFWKNKLTGASLTLELPSDKPRPSVQIYRGRTLGFSFGEQLSSNLRALSRSEGVTLFTALFACLYAVLHRYTNQEDIIVGCPVSIRNRPELENLIGPLSNALPIRVSLSGDPDFRELLGRVRDSVLEAFEHQELPFEKLIDELKIPRDLSRSPVFQITYILHQGGLEQTLQLPGTSVSRTLIDLGTARFDLSVDVEDKGKELIAIVEHNTDLFDTPAIHRFLGHWQEFVQSAVAHPELPISKLAVLTPAERDQLIDGWNDTAVAYPAASVHQLFESQAERTPDSIAAVFGNHQITYRELNARSNQMARYLRKCGVGPETLVGICMERSLDMLITLLGILKAGGAYVPLDPGYPRERLSFMLEDSELLVLLTRGQLSTPIRSRLICIDVEGEAPSIARESSANPGYPAAPDQLAYVLYTSGSTGTPKGVQITHGAFANLLHAMQQQPGLRETDVLVAVTTLSFDIAGLELFLPLITGARLVIASQQEALDGARLLELLAASHATILQATPVTWRMLLEAGWRTPRMKLLCGGEALPRDLANQLLQRGELWNMYGPTETTIWSSVSRIEPGSDPVTIGSPIANTQFYILDPHQNPVPIGVPGELHIGGDGVARGYLKRPELTAERFIPDPFRTQAQARLYKTGDLARYLPDGCIELLGRMDHQVKLRGYRIELGEVESALARVAGIRQAVVMAREDVPGQKRLVAYLIAVEGSAPARSDLIDSLKQRLPEYMLPSAFVFLQQMPATPNGKVDRRALPPPEAARPDAHATLLAPRNETEAKLAGLWETLLGVKGIGMRDSFFDLGGESLLAVRLFVQIEKTFGKKLPLAVLFQSGTIEHLADLLRQDSAPAQWSSLQAMHTGGTRPPLFCVHPNTLYDLRFKDLAAHLGSDQPFYALQPMAPENADKQYTFVGMAAHNIEEMRQVQPHGPYYLSGYCFGGQMAFEMALQLQKLGEEVAFLGLLDTFGPLYRPPTLVDLVWLSVQKFRTLRSSERAAFLARKWGNLRHRASRMALHLRPAQRSPGSFPEYAPGVYPGRLTLFCIQDVERDYVIGDSSLGWNTLAQSGIEIIEVPGGHETLLKQPHVSVLASRLLDCLNKYRQPFSSAFTDLQHNSNTNSAKLHSYSRR